ncbi:hypothetical protein TL16_g02417 [Triparma laevis f. inornata]|uniref:Uncharacterized protein n=1 Tax=Triparma laevis f. inornata TaxID=1714386 RepID=A0A9W6ZX94_9STRA|nr:hypothetical protein TL16_g02417 [Triparma laevis f. inornata]
MFDRTLCVAFTLLVLLPLSKCILLPRGLKLPDVPEGAKAFVDKLDLLYKTQSTTSPTPPPTLTSLTSLLNSSLYTPIPPPSPCHDTLLPLPLQPTYSGLLSLPGADPTLFNGKPSSPPISSPIIFNSTSTPTITANRTTLRSIYSTDSWGGFKLRLLKNLFTKTKLVEPTYEEVVVLWCPSPKKPSKRSFFRRKPSVKKLLRKPKTPTPLPSPQIRIFQNVPLTSLPSTLPSYTLRYKTSDSFRLDIISLLTFFPLLLKLTSLKYKKTLAILTVIWFIRSFLRYNNIRRVYRLALTQFLERTTLFTDEKSFKYLTEVHDEIRAVYSGIVADWLMKGYDLEEDIVERGLEELRGIGVVDRVKGEWEDVGEGIEKAWGDIIKKV